MRKVTLAEKVASIQARWDVVGKPDAATIERARNNGSTRTESKRELLATLGLWSRLSDEQKKAALAYDGPESHGRGDLPAIKR